MKLSEMTWKETIYNVIDKNTYVRTIVNDYGEEIHIKIDDRKIFIHHEDAHNDFVPLEEFLMFTIVGKDELFKMYETIKDMVSPGSLIAEEYIKKHNYIKNPTI